MGLADSLKIDMPLLLLQKKRLRQSMALYNKINKEILKEKMMHSQEERHTLSFYRYHPIEDPHHFRDVFFQNLSELGVLGRIYVATEGVNAQISVPAKSFEAFLDVLNQTGFLKVLLPHF